VADPFFAASRLVKRFGNTLALNEVGIELAAGEILALVGENGAGKSTLASILGGLTKPEGGSMRLGGEAYSPSSRVDAERLGVRIVLQELNLIGTLSVAENLFLRRMPRKFGLIDIGGLHAQARELLARVGLEKLDPSCPVGSLGTGTRQMIEIAASLAEDCRLLILDEPTAALTEVETERLFDHVLRLKKGGTAVIYVSHRMEEIQRLADRIAILRDGKLVASRPAAGVSLDEVIRLMVGREVGTGVWCAKRKRDVALRVTGLRRGSAVKDVSFDLFQGEILGVAGLMGSGRTETVRAVFGADRKDAGEIFLAGSQAPIKSTGEAVRRGVALLTEDRKDQGLLLPRPIRENVTLPRLRTFARRGGWIRLGAESTAAQSLTKRLDVRCRSIEQPVAELSGGNQQKVVFAKWIGADSEVLLIDEPTRGVDVGAKFEIYRILNELARKGKAILVVSSDLPELMALCDRIMVMSAGRVAATFARGEWSADRIMAAALSGFAGQGSQEAPN